MSPDEARHLINTEGREHVMLGYFVKKNDQTRRMLFVYDGKSSPKPWMMVVEDIERGQTRTLNLETLTELRVLKSRVRRAEDRPPKKPDHEPGSTHGAFSEDFLKAQQAIQELFY